MKLSHLAIPFTLFVVIILTRVPLLGNGFGTDPDAWRNAVGTLRMLDVGHYVPSRPPGFPVFEMMLLAFVPLGWVASNLMTSVAGAVSALLLLAVARKLRVRNALWVSLALAFSGMVWVRCTQTIDYAVGLAFVIGCYWALLDRRHVLAGVLLALAAGCRLTNGALVAPALAMLVVRRDGWRSTTTFAASFVVATVVVLIPVMATLDPERLGRGGVLGHVARGHVTGARLSLVLRSSAVYLFGKLGAAALVLGVVWSVVGAVRRRFATRPLSTSSPADPARDMAPVVFEAGAVIVVGVLFLLIPYEPSYLTPLVPFALLIAARVLARPWFVAVALLAISEVLVMPLFGQKRVVAGRLFQEVEQRKAELASTRALETRRPDEPTVFVIGRFATHRLLVLDPSLERTDAAWAPFHASGVALWTGDRHIGYAEELDAPARAALEADGYRIEDISP
jgi:hypothetical protein